MAKNCLKNFKGKVFIVDDPHTEGCSPSFYTGFSSYVTKNTKEATLDPYVFFYPKMDLINSNKVWNVYAMKPIQINLRDIGSGKSFTKDFRKYETEVRKLCEDQNASKKSTDIYLKIAEKMTSKKIDVDDMVKSEAIRKKMKSGNFLDLLTENI